MTVFCPSFPRFFCSHAFNIKLQQNSIEYPLQNTTVQWMHQITLYQCLLDNTSLCICTGLCWASLCHSDTSHFHQVIGSHAVEVTATNKSNSFTIALLASKWPQKLTQSLHINRLKSTHESIGSHSPHHWHRLLVCRLSLSELVSLSFSPSVSERERTKTKQNKKQERTKGTKKELNIWGRGREFDTRHCLNLALFTHSVCANFGLRLMLIDSDWCWLMLIDADCWF